MEDEKSTSQTKIVGKTAGLRRRTEESIEAIIAHANSSEPVLSDRNVSKYFALRAETIKAIRADHVDVKDLTKHGRKYNLLYMITGGLIVLIIIVLLGHYDKQYLEQFFQLLFAFLGGTGVGSYITGRNKDE